MGWTVIKKLYCTPWKSRYSVASHLRDHEPSGLSSSVFLMNKRSLLGIIRIVFPVEIPSQMCSSYVDVYEFIVDAVKQESDLAVPSCQLS